MRGMGDAYAAREWANSSETDSERPALAVAPAVQSQIFADPTPLGLIGLAIGCAALLPIALGVKVGASGLITAAVFCGLFGGGCQLIAGLLNLANKNSLGGTVFTAFAFNWAV